MAKAISLKIVADSSEFDAAFKRATEAAASLGREIKGITHVSTDTNNALKKQQSGMRATIAKLAEKQAALRKTASAGESYAATLKKQNTSLGRVATNVRHRV